MNRDQVDPIEKILAESVFSYHLGQVTVSRTYHPDIHLPRPAVAQHLEGLILQNPQEFHLT